MKAFRLPGIFLFVVFSVVQTHSQSKTLAQTGQQEKPPGVLDTPVDFSGWKGITGNPELLKEIRIGFFASSEPEDPIGGPMFNAASLAVEEINAAGGFQGIPFRLVKRWANNPWGSASKEMIKLVYQDSVWAVIGSINGTTTHIAEQVVTKARVPLLSPVSTDPTLTYIRTPWMFRIPPDDQKQAEVIVKEASKKSSLKKVGLITSTDHDGRIFAMEILSLMKKENNSPVFHFQISLSRAKFKDIVERATSFKPEGVILRLPWVETLDLLVHFQNSDFDIPIFIPWIPGLLEADLANRYDGDILYVQPFSETGNSLYAAFAQIYQERYGASPTPGAAYAYDAVNILIQSLQKSGLNRSRLREVIARLDNFQGVTGKCIWDNGGGNLTEPVFRILFGKSSIVPMQKINILH